LTLLLDIKTQSIRTLFNSPFHKEAFLDELPRLLKHFPDYNELATIKQIAEKSAVLPLGPDLQRFDTHRPPDHKDGQLRILWNHRWEYDKQPEIFFEALYALQDEGMDF
jgi:glycosyltransferase involved in cell wall biosynthesis